MLRDVLIPDPCLQSPKCAILLFVFCVAQYLCGDNWGICTLVRPTMFVHYKLNISRFSSFLTLCERPGLPIGILGLAAIIASIFHIELDFPIARIGFKMDKGLLADATSQDDSPTPGYMLNEISSMLPSFDFGWIALLYHRCFRIHPFQLSSMRSDSGLFACSRCSEAP